jgi:hypothetical protein
MPVKGQEISESAAATPSVKGETFSDAVPEAEKAPAIVTEAQAKPLVADYKAEAALVIEVKEADEIKAVVDAASPTEQPAPSVENLQVADAIGSEDMKDELNVAMDSAAPFIEQKLGQTSPAPVAEKPSDPAVSEEKKFEAAATATAIADAPQTSAVENNEAIVVPQDESVKRIDAVGFREAVPEASKVEVPPAAQDSDRVSDSEKTAAGGGDIDSTKDDANKRGPAKEDAGDIDLVAPAPSPAAGPSALALKGQPAETTLSTL